MSFLKKWWHKLAEWHKRQPDITVSVFRPMPKVQPEPFELKGLIMQSDAETRKITEGGTSKHVTIPAAMVPNLPGSFHYCARFEAQGKTGLLFIGDGEE